MKIIHYIPSIDRTAGGTSTYIKVLDKELDELTEWTNYIKSKY